MDETGLDPTGDDGRELTPRPPDGDDFVALCRRLNETGARYIVIGGLAIIYSGYGRFTEDIDLLVCSG